MDLGLDKREIEKRLQSLISHCNNDEKLQNDKQIRIIINFEKKLKLPQQTNTQVPRIIPLSNCKLNDYKNLHILLILKDPILDNKEILNKSDITNEIFNEILSIKQLSKKGKHVTSFLKQFDLVVVDYRLHHLILKLTNNNKVKTPFIIRISKSIKQKGAKMNEIIDPKFLKSQIKSISKNSYYIPYNNDKSINVLIGNIKTTNTKEMVSNIFDTLKFLTDKKYEPQGGIIKSNILSLYVKSENSISLPIYDSSNIM